MAWPDGCGELCAACSWALTLSAQKSGRTKGLHDSLNIPRGKCAPSDHQTQPPSKNIWSDWHFGEIPLDARGSHVGGEGKDG